MLNASEKEMQQRKSRKMTEPGVKCVEEKESDSFCVEMTRWFSRHLKLYRASWCVNDTVKNVAPLLYQLNIIDEALTVMLQYLSITVYAAQYCVVVTDLSKSLSLATFPGIHLLMSLSVYLFV